MRNGTPEGSVGDVPLDPIAIDVGGLLQRTVTSLYAHLVTRPTGRAVRMAIETRLQDAGRHSLSLIDLSEVSILDFSCADEVVAKLIQRYLENPAHQAFFVFRGVHEPHRDQIQVVLERQELAAVAETAPGVFELLGRSSEGEARAWSLLESRGLVSDEEWSDLFDPPTLAGTATGQPASTLTPAPAPFHPSTALDSLVERRLAFRSPSSGRVHALSRLVHHLL
jgi:hypothetical protein